MLVEKNDEITRIKQKFSGDDNTERSDDETKIDNTTRAYVKNILLKFLEY